MLRFGGQVIYKKRRCDYVRVVWGSGVDRSRSFLDEK